MTPLPQPEDDAIGFPMPRRCPTEPPPEYAALRDAAPLVRARFRDKPVWLVTRHAAARQVLTSPLISTDPTHPGHPFAEMVGSPEEQAGQFIDMDPPRHGLYRRLVISEFSHHRAQELRPRIAAIVDDVIGALRTTPDPDLVTDFGMPVATFVICELLGVPYTDRDLFHQRVKVMVDGFYSDEAARTARTELYDYLRSLVGQAVPGATDTLIDRLVSRAATVEGIDEDDVVGMVFLLLVAGHQTVANMLPLSVFTLLQHPDQLARLQCDPGLWRGAVEELFRYLSIVDWVAFDRIAVVDTVIDDVLVRAGEGLFVLGGSANRDGRVFEAPDTFEISRPARPHLAFGHGVHQCLGANLARVEVEVALRGLFAAVPGIRSAVPEEELPFALEARTYGMRSFPVRW